MADVVSDPTLVVSRAIEDTGPGALVISRHVTEPADDGDDTDHGPRDRVYNRLLPVWNV